MRDCIILKFLPDLHYLSVRGLYSHTLSRTVKGLRFCPVYNLTMTRSDFHGCWQKHSGSETEGFSTHSTPGSRRFMFTSPLLLTLSKFDRGYKKVVLGDGEHTVGSYSR